MKKRVLSILLAIMFCVSLLPVTASAATAAPQEVSTWTELQAALSAGGDIILTADVTPDNPFWADALTVSSGVTATLDLNGHTVDRGYTEQGFDGSVIKVSGTLTVIDSDPAAGGVITGGFPDQYGGGVQILGGTFNLQGGSITGNSVGKTGFFGSEGLGGGVYLQSGTFNMSGGAITGNKALGSTLGSNLGRGGGVYITGGAFSFTGGEISGNDAGAIGGGVYLASTYSGHDGTINVSGGAAVTDNTVGGADSNVYLEDGGVITVTDALTGTIGVTMQTPGVFTGGLNGRGTTDNFKSDDAGLAVSLTDAGEAQLAEKHIYSVTVTPGEHMTLSSGSESQTDLTGAMTDVIYTANDGYYFPTDYAVASVNGISVTRSSDTQITVSGTPTADAGITLPAAAEYLYPLWIGGVQVKGSNKNDITSAINAAAGSTVASGTASLSLNAYGYTEGKPLHYDLTLTLTDFEYTGQGCEFESGKYAAVYFKGNGERGEGFYPKFYAEGELIVDVNGECSITQQLDDPSASVSGCYGIYAYSGGNRDTGLYFQNSGSLTVAVGNNGAKDVASGIYVYGHCYAHGASLTCVGPASGATVSSGITLYSRTYYLCARNGGAITASGADYAVRDRTAGDNYSLIQYKTDDYSLIVGANADGSGAARYTGATTANGINTNVNAKNLANYKYVAIKHPSFTVTVTPGEHMTLSSGSESQTDLTGAMTDVIYTVNDGYYFPTDYAAASVNGISVTRNSDTQITVSGTPTADAVITLISPTAIPAVPAAIPDSATTAVESYNRLAFAAVEGQEYVLAADGAAPDWTGTLTPEDGEIVLTDLNGGARYAVYTRVAATDTAPAGAAVATPFVTAVSSYGWFGNSDPGLIGGTFTADFDAVAPLDYQWYSCDDENGANESAIAGETNQQYTVAAAIEGKYYFAKAFIDGIEVGAFSPIGPASYGTVIFDSKGGADVGSQSGLVYGDKLTVAEPTRDGYYFAQWYLDEEYTEAWTLDTNIVNAVETVLYAKWSRIPLETFEGTLYEADGTTPLAGATVTLTQGSATLGAAVTDADGKFTFKAPEGTYNIVAEKNDVFKTALVELEANHAITVSMPEGKRSSLVFNYSAGAFPVTVGGLDAVADGITAGANDDVAVILRSTADANTGFVLSAGQLAEFEAGKAAIRALPDAGSKTLEFFSLTLEKTVNDGEPTDIGGTNTQLLTIIIPYDTSGRNNITVYRYHGAAAEAMTRNPAAGEEGFTVGDGFITIYARSFSAYAIGYRMAGSSGGSGGGTTGYRVTVTANAGGTASVNPTIPESGDKVTVTVKPDKGFVTASVAVTDASGKAVAVTKNADGTYSYTQPDSRVTVDVRFRETGKSSANPFADVAEDAYYHDAVLWAYENGITSGTAPTTFSPYDKATRAQTVTFIWRAAGCPEPTSTENPFTDVSEDDYYYKAVLWAYENGITLGTDDTAFSPSGTVDRSQVTAFLYRYIKSLGGGFTGAWAFPLLYNDAQSVPEYAYEAFCYMTMEDIIQGGDDNNLMPLEDCLRCQIVTILYRYFTK